MLFNLFVYFKGENSQSLQYFFALIRIFIFEVFNIFICSKAPNTWQSSEYQRLSLASFSK
jgi:hypothetical protein